MANSLILYCGMLSYFSIFCLECAFLYSGLLAYMLVLIYLGGSYIHLSLGTLLWVVKMLLGKTGRGCIQNIKSVVILGSVHSEPVECSGGIGDQLSTIY